MSWHKLLLGSGAVVVVLAVGVVIQLLKTLADDLDLFERT
jgi:hypothetical protein